MKKILLISAVLLGAATTSQAGVRINLGFGIPMPAPVVIAPPAPVYVQPAPFYVAPAYCSPAPVVVTQPVIGFGYGRYHRPFWHGFYHRR